MVAASFVPTNAPTPLYVLWQSELRFPTSAITLLFAAYVVGLLAALPIAGRCADRFGQRPVLLLGLSAAMASCAVFASAQSVPLLLVARFICGLAAAAGATAGVALVVEMGSSNPGRASKVGSFSIVVGAALGPLIAGSIATLKDRPVTPVFLTVFLLLSFATVLATRFPSLPRVRRRTTGPLGLPTVPPGNRSHLTCGILSLGCSLGATGFILSLGPSVLRDLTGNTSPLMAGLMACLTFTSGALVQLPAGRVPALRTFGFSAAAVVMAMACLGAAVAEANASLMIAAAMAGGAGYGLAQLAGLTLVGLHVPAERRAEANAVLHMGGYVPCGLMPIGGGLLVDRWGLPAGTVTFAVLLSIAAMSAFAFISARMAR